MIVVLITIIRIYEKDTLQIIAKDKQQSSNLRTPSESYKYLAVCDNTLNMMVLYITLSVINYR